MLCGNSLMSLSILLHFRFCPPAEFSSEVIIHYTYYSHFSKGNLIWSFLPIFLMHVGLIIQLFRYVLDCTGLDVMFMMKNLTGANEFIELYWGIVKIIFLSPFYRRELGCRKSGSELQKSPKSSALINWLVIFKKFYVISPLKSSAKIWFIHCRNWYRWEFKTYAVQTITQHTLVSSLSKLSLYIFTEQIAKCWHEPELLWICENSKFLSADWICHHSHHKLGTKLK